MPGIFGCQALYIFKSLINLIQTHGFFPFVESYVNIHKMSNPLEIVRVTQEQCQFRWDILASAWQDHEAKQIQSHDPEKKVKPFKQFLNNLSFQDKLFIVRRLTDKIVATKEEVTICGFIPLLSNAEAKKLMENTNEATGKVKYGPIYRYCWPTQRRQVHPF